MSIPLLDVAPQLLGLFSVLKVHFPLLLGIVFIALSSSARSFSPAESNLSRIPSSVFHFRHRGFYLQEPRQSHVCLPPVSMSSDADLVSLKFLVGFSGLVTLLIVAPVFLLQCLLVSDWVAGIVNFSLLGPEYFCIRIHFLKLISEMQSGFLGRVLSLQTFVTCWATLELLSVQDNHLHS